MEAKEALYRWSKHKNESEDFFLKKWLEDGHVDGWGNQIHISDVEVTLDQYGILAVVKGRIRTFERTIFQPTEKFCKLHLHLNMFGTFRCVGSTSIDNDRYSNLPDGAVNGTQIIFGKRKPTRSEGRKILDKAKNFNSVYYSKKVHWNTNHGQQWSLGEEWFLTEIASRGQEK